MTLRQSILRHLNEPLLHFVRVFPQGGINQTALAAASRGHLAGAAIDCSPSHRQPNSPAGNAGTMFLTVTSTRIVFFRINPLGDDKVGSLVAEYNRADCSYCKVSRGRMELPFIMTRPIFMQMIDGQTFLLESMTPCFLWNGLKKLSALLTTHK
jgi:hypothetical protein